MEDKWDVGFLRPLPEKTLYPNCPICGSANVAGIFYASTNFDIRDGMVSAAHACSWQSKPRPMWHCHGCEHNFGN